MLLEKGCLPKIFIENAPPEVLPYLATPCCSPGYYKYAYIYGAREYSTMIKLRTISKLFKGSKLRYIRFILIARKLKVRVSMKFLLPIAAMAAANCFFATGSSLLRRSKNGLNGVHLTFGVYHASSFIL